MSNDPAHIEDVAKAFAWTVRNISKHGGDPNKIIVSGHSAGAYLIGLLAYDQRYLEREKLSSDRMLAVIPISGFYFVDRVAPMPDRPRSVWGNDPKAWLAACPRNMSARMCRGPSSYMRMAMKIEEVSDLLRLSTMDRFTCPDYDHGGHLT